MNPTSGTFLSVAVTIFLLVSFSLGAGSAHAGVFTNGGFDDYTGAPSPAASNLNDQVPVSWIGSTNNADLDTTQGEIVAPHSGTHFFEFKTNNSSYVYQTFDTISGTTYDLSFYSARPQTNNTNNDFDVDVFSTSGDPGGVANLGDLLDQKVLDSDVAGGGVWTSFEFDFTATSAQSTLRFLDDGSVSVDPAIDSVAITAQPGGGGGGGGGVPAVILQTDFTGRTVSGKTASNIPWTTDGVQDPGDLTWVLEGGGPANTSLFDTANAQGHFAPDLNTGNEGPWSATIPLTLTEAEISLEDVVLDWQHFSNTGAFQGANRSVDWTVSVSGSLSGVLDSVTAANISGKSGVETLTFAAPLTLTDSESWALKIHAEGSNTNGNNTGLDALTVNGSISTTAVPEPSTVVLAVLGLLLLLGRYVRR